MDINTLRIVVMIVGLIIFLVFWSWIWSAKNKKSYEEAAQLPFSDEENPL